MFPRTSLYTMRKCLDKLVGLTAAFLGLFISVGGSSTVIAQSESGVVQPRPKSTWPESPFVIDVTKPPYSAKGDGITDDTAALQKALDDHMGLHHMLYFPAGTYVISKTLVWSKRNSAGREAWGMNWVQGHHASTTKIVLRDRVATDPTKPVAMMWCGGFGSADWFHNYVQDITFDVGKDNPGATALQFYSNNAGAIRGCRFVAPPESGHTGLDLAHRDMNGPLLVQDCSVQGFARGIATGNAVNSQTFERVELQGQREVGFTNEGQTISIHRLLSRNAVPAIRTYGTMCVVDAELIGMPGAEVHPAVLNFNGGRIYVRALQAPGYRRALADLQTPDAAAAYRLADDEQPASRGPKLASYSSKTTSTLFSIASEPQRLEVRDPPNVGQDPFERWANVDDFGADPTAQKDSSEAFQKAIDSGATTLFLPGSYALQRTVIVRNRVHRIVGVGGQIDYEAKARPDFRIEDGDGQPLTIEFFAHVNGGFEIDSPRTVTVRSIMDGRIAFTQRAAEGELFLEDFVTHDLQLPRRQVWARQLNIENEGTHITNIASQLWILGYKTERGGTLLDARPGSATEILGGFSYTTTAGKLAPMLVIQDADVFAYFGEICFNGDPFATLVRETKSATTRELPAGEGLLLPFAATAR